MIPFVPQRCLSFLLPCMFVAGSVRGQDTPDQEGAKKTRVEFEGMVSASVGADAWAVNVGGPSFKVKLNKNVAVGAGALPSFVSWRDRQEPRLGLSPRVDYKHWVLVAPVYFFSGSDGGWVYTFGLGHKFH